MPKDIGSVPNTTLVRRAEAAWNIKGLGRRMREDAYRYTVPNRLLENRTTPNSEKGDLTFDSTGVVAAKRFAGRMVQGLVPPFEHWARLVTGPLVPTYLEGDRQRNLDVLSKVFFTFLNSSKWNSASHALFMELHVGNAVLYIKENQLGSKHPFTCHAIPELLVSWDEGPEGEIDGVFRNHEVKVRNLARKWPGIDLTASQSLSEIINDPEKQEEKVKLVEVTYFDPNDMVIRKDGVEFAWIHKILWMDENEEGDQKIRTLWVRRYPENPFIIVRWSVLAGEVDGRGPTLDALGDLRTINEVVKMTLQQAVLDLAPPWMVSDYGVINPDNMKIKENALIPVMHTNGPNGPPIVPLTSGSRVDLSNILIDDLRMSIKKVLFDDQLPPQNDAVRSATEIIERIRQLNEDVGGVFGRLHDELIVKVFQRVLSILYRHGHIQEPIELDGLGVSVVVESPLARTQRMREVQTYTDFLSLVSQFGGIQGLTLASKIEDGFTWIGHQLGVPAELLRTPAEREQMQREAAAIVAAQGQGGEVIQQGAGNQGPGTPAAEIATREA